MAAPSASLLNVVEQRELKWIFVGGKGGVGKTTCSSCLAVLLAQTREKVLIISTDPAHNLSDAFRQKFSKHPTLVQGFSNLYALEVDPSVDSDALTSVDRQMGGGMEGLAELANSIPGIDEAMSFGEMLKLVQSMDYSVIVFDTAPTGHTLRLLQFPSTLEKGLTRLLALKQRLGGIMDQMTRSFGMGEEFQAGSLLGRLEGMKAAIESVNQQFKDPKLTTFVCVCIPEFLSLYETERLVQELARFEIDTRNIVINQVLFPDDADDSPLLRARVRMQQKYLDQFQDLYEEFHLVRLPLKPEEVRGVEALKDFSELLVREYKPTPSPHSSEIARLQAQVSELKQQLAEAQALLETKKQAS